MNSSLISSSLHGAKPFHSPVHMKKLKQPQFHVVSCSASTKFARENETPNFYKVLSLNTSNASIDEVKRAYRNMALKYHPDVCHDPSMKEESTRKFVQLHLAYKTLSDPTLRVAYDCELGLRKFSRQKSKMDVIISREVAKNMWQEQILELKRRSSYRMAHKEGSWGSRIRAQNMKKE